MLRQADTKTNHSHRVAARSEWDGSNPPHKGVGLTKEALRVHVTTAGDTALIGLGLIVHWIGVTTTLLTYGTIGSHLDKQLDYTQQSFQFLTTLTTVSNTRRSCRTSDYTHEHTKKLQN